MLCIALPHSLKAHYRVWESQRVVFEDLRLGMLGVSGGEDGDRLTNTDVFDWVGDYSVCYTSNRTGSIQLGWALAD